MAEHAGAVPLSRWERAAGLALGLDQGAPRLETAAAQGPREALANAVRVALRRPPCLVSFSGGRDSSIVLALAARGAGELGLPAPIPATLRFPGLPSTEESAWQERVVRHLGLGDWQRVELAGELDFLGELATAGLQTHGLLWPPNTHFHAPIFAAAAGGSVLTGFDGDGLFGAWRWQRAAWVLHRRCRPEPRDLLRVGLALAPRPLRREILLHRIRTPVTWLRPAAQRRLRQILADEAAHMPRRWDERLARYARERFFTVPMHSLSLLANRHDVEVFHPLADPDFLAALAREGGRAGYGDRVAAVRYLFGGLLPGDVLARTGKAEFGEAMWGPQARRFAAQWDGRGVDRDLVDHDRLRAAWAEPNPPLAAATLLQEAWLASTRSRRAARWQPSGAPPGPAAG